MAPRLVCFVMKQINASDQRGSSIRRKTCYYTCQFASQCITMIEGRNSTISKCLEYGEETHFMRVTKSELFLFTSRPIFFLRSSRNRAGVLSYESKTTDKRQQYDWMGGKNLDGLASYSMAVLS